MEAWLQNGPVVCWLECSLSFLGDERKIFILTDLPALLKDVTGMSKVFATAKSALSRSN